jgi:hypothetical protein
MEFLTEAIEKLSATPEKAAQLARGLSEEQLSKKPSAELFSVRESILHLRDIDVEGYEPRLGRILAEDAPSFADVDGARLARERNYNAQPVEPALAELAIVRAASMERLLGCNGTDLERTAQMEGAGVVTLRRLLEMWMQHDADHLADMIEMRRAIEVNDPRPSFGKHQAA